jgi:hypothetical protein
MAERPRRGRTRARTTPAAADPLIAALVDLLRSAEAARPRARPRGRMPRP